MTAVVVKAKGAVAPKPVERAFRTNIAWLIDRHDGAPNFELRKFTMRPGGRIPRHYHHDIEHEQYVLSGRYRVGVGEKVYRVGEGDSLYIPAGTPHWYENDGRRDAVFLCVVPKRGSYGAVYLDEAEGAPADLALPRGGSGRAAHRGRQRRRRT